MNWKIGQKKMFRISIDKIIENREDKEKRVQQEGLIMSVFGISGEEEWEWAEALFEINWLRFCQWWGKSHI